MNYLGLGFRSALRGHLYGTLRADTYMMFLYIMPPDIFKLKPINIISEK